MDEKVRGRGLNRLIKANVEVLTPPHGNCRGALNNVFLSLFYKHLAKTCRFLGRFWPVTFDEKVETSTLTWSLLRKTSTTVIPNV